MRCRIYQRPVLLRPRWVIDFNAIKLRCVECVEVSKCGIVTASHVERSERIFLSKEIGEVDVRSQAQRCQLVVVDPEAVELDVVAKVEGGKQVIAGDHHFYLNIMCEVKRSELVEVYTQVYNCGRSGDMQGCQFVCVGIQGR